MLQVQEPHLFWFLGMHSPNPKPNGGRASRDKGNRTERALVRFLQDRGFAAERGDSLALIGA